MDFNDSGIAKIISDQFRFRRRKRIKKNTIQRPSILPEIDKNRKYHRGAPDPDNQAIL